MDMKTPRDTHGPSLAMNLTVKHQDKRQKQGKRLSYGEKCEEVEDERIVHCDEFEVVEPKSSTIHRDMKLTIISERKRKMVVSSSRVRCLSSLAIEGSVMKKRRQHVHLMDLPTSVHAEIVSFFISKAEDTDVESIVRLGLTSKSWNKLCTENSLLWKESPTVTSSGALNRAKFIGGEIIAEGTEGTCYRCIERGTLQKVTIKKARVYPDGEGVPYYVLRELAVLQRLDHPNICPLRYVALRDFQLWTIFTYAPLTLQQCLNGAVKRGETISENIVQPLFKQLADAVSHCHSYGVLHRNLKPKHLLIHPGRNLTNPLDGAKLQLADFALVRQIGYPLRTYTKEVVTLWYRPPEILLGNRMYSPSVDIWSLGCILVEMLTGQPFFTGISEIDQLFQIFSKLSTPTRESWPDFTSMPHYSFDFPDWKENKLHRYLSHCSAKSIDLAQRLLRHNPAERLYAEEILQHPFIKESDLKPYIVQESASIRSVVEEGLDDRLISSMKAHEKDFYSYRSLSLSLGITTRQIKRENLVYWMLDVIESYDMTQRTAFLTMTIFDRYLMQKKDIEIPPLQLVGATCLHIASKCEDVSYIGVRDISFCTDQEYPPKEILKLEERILSTLQCKLSIPTSIDFLHTIMEVRPELRHHRESGDSMVYYLSQYLLEISLYRFNYREFLPSLVATSAIVLARWTLNMVYRVASLHRLTDHSLPECKRCIQMLHEDHEYIESRGLQPRDRYASLDRGEVAFIAVRPLYDFNFSSVDDS